MSKKAASKETEAEKDLAKTYNAFKFGGKKYTKVQDIPQNENEPVETA